MIRYLTLFVACTFVANSLEARSRPLAATKIGKVIGVFDVISSRPLSGNDMTCDALSRAFERKGKYSFVKCSGLEIYNIRRIKIIKGNFDKNIPVYSGSIDGQYSSPDFDGDLIPIYMIEDGIDERLTLHLDMWRAGKNNFYVIDSEKTE